MTRITRAIRLFTIIWICTLAAPALAQSGFIRVADALSRIRRAAGNGTSSLPVDVKAELTFGESDLRFSVYPTVFSGTTTFQFVLPEDGRATLKMYDYLGRQVSILADGEYKAGEVNRVVYNSMGLSSGMYICRLYTATAIASEKVILQK